MSYLDTLRAQYPDELGALSDDELLLDIAEVSGTSLQGAASLFGADPAKYQQSQGFLGDTGRDLAVGLSKVPEGLAGLVDMVNPVPGPHTSQLVDNIYDATGVSDWQDRQQHLYSDARQDARSAVNEGFDQGLGQGALALAQNPRYALGALAESIPGMVAGGWIGRGVTAAGRLIPGINQKLLPYVGAGVGEGAYAGGAAVDQILEQGGDPAAAEQAGWKTAGVVGAVGGLGGAATRKLGGDDFDLMLAGGGRAQADAPLTLAQRGRRLGVGTGGEGLQEAPQSAAETYFANEALGRDPTEGVGRATIEGFAVGSLMGAGTNVSGPRIRRDGERVDLTQDQAAPPEAPSAAGVGGPTPTSPTPAAPSGPASSTPETQLALPALEETTTPETLREAPLPKDKKLSNTDLVLDDPGEQALAEYARDNFKGLGYTKQINARGLPIKLVMTEVHNLALMDEVALQDYAWKRAKAKKPGALWKDDLIRQRAEQLGITLSTTPPAAAPVQPTAPPVEAAPAGVMEGADPADVVDAALNQLRAPAAPPVVDAQAQQTPPPSPAAPPGVPPAATPTVAPTQAEPVAQSPTPPSAAPDVPVQGVVQAGVQPGAVAEAPAPTPVQAAPIPAESQAARPAEPVIWISREGAEAAGMPKEVIQKAYIKNGRLSDTGLGRYLHTYGEMSRPELREELQGLETSTAATAGPRIQYLQWRLGEQEQSDTPAVRELYEQSEQLGQEVAGFLTNNTAFKRAPKQLGTLIDRLTADLRNKDQKGKTSSANIAKQLRDAQAKIDAILSNSDRPELAAQKTKLEEFLTRSLEIEEGLKTARQQAATRAQIGDQGTTSEASTPRMAEIETQADLEDFSGRNPEAEGAAGDLELNTSATTISPERKAELKARIGSAPTEKAPEGSGLLAELGVIERIRQAKAVPTTMYRNETNPDTGETRRAKVETMRPTKSKDVSNIRVQRWAANEIVSDPATSPEVRAQASQLITDLDELISNAGSGFGKREINDAGLRTADKKQITDVASRIAKGQTPQQIAQEMESPQAGRQAQQLLQTMEKAGVALADAPKFVSSQVVGARGALGAEIAVERETTAAEIAALEKQATNAFTNEGRATFGEFWDYVNTSNQGEIAWGKLSYTEQIDLSRRLESSTTIPEVANAIKNYYDELRTARKPDPTYSEKPTTPERVEGRAEPANGVGQAGAFAGAAKSAPSVTIRTKGRRGQQPAPEASIAAEGQAAPVGATQKRADEQNYTLNDVGRQRVAQVERDATNPGLPPARRRAAERLMEDYRLAQSTGNGANMEGFQSTMRRMADHVDTQQAAPETPAAAEGQAAPGVTNRETGAKVQIKTKPNRRIPKPAAPDASLAERHQKQHPNNQAVDASGKPTVFYHGTQSDVESFRAGEDTNGIIYVTTDNELVNKFTRGKGYISADKHAARAEFDMFAYDLNRKTTQFDVESAKATNPQAVAQMAKRRKWEYGPAADKEAFNSLSESEQVQALEDHYFSLVGEGGNVLPLFVNAENIAGTSDKPAYSWKEMDAIGAEGLRKQGYDAAWVDEGGGQVSLAVTNPAQLKSAIGNTGAFDATNPDIRKGHAFGKAENPTTKATFTQAVRKFLGTNSHWRVHTYESMDQVPTDALHGVSDSGAYGWVAPDSKGVLHAHFVLDRIEQGTELGKMLHEIGAHIGLSNILPKDLYQNLHSKIAEWALEARLALDTGDLSPEQMIAMRAWARMRANTKGMSEAVKTDELIAYFVEEAVAAGIDPTGIKTKGPLGQILRQVWAAFKAALKKLGVQNIDQLTPQDIVDLAYGAARLDLDAGTATASTAEALRFGHPESRGNLDFIPEPYRKSAGNILDSIKDAAKNGHYGLAFLHDLVDHIEAKAKPLAEPVRSFKDAVDRIGVARQRFEKRASDVMAVTSSMKPEQVDQINQYLDFARRDAAWGYQPEWLSDPVEIKDASKAEFDKLSSVQQQVVKDVHRILHENLTEKRRLLSQRIKDHYATLIEQADDDALAARLEAERDSKIKQLPTLLQMSGPYSPWKRHGSHVVAYHSPELREAFDNEDHKLIAELRKDAKHYVLEFAEGYGEARTRARKLAEEFGEGNVQYFEKAAWRDQIPGRFADLEKLKRTISQLPTAATKGDKASQSRLEGMVEELILQSLTQDHARQSNRKAEGVAGADPDMLRSFADQARADAHHMSNLMHLGDANQALRDLARAAEKGSGQDRHAYQKMANAIYWHWEKTLDYIPTPIADRLTAVSSTWHLLTSVGYHLQNATQVEMMSVPWMAKDYGYGATQAATLKAYKDMSGMIKGSKFWDHLKTDLVPDDVKQAIRDLEDQGVIDIFMDLELGTISNAPGANKLTRSGRKVLEALRRMPAKVETVNRVVTATAAYRLAKPRLGHEKAVKYAREVIETTHGTYSGLETPKFISPKRWGGGAKIVFQFRKFQLIQLAYMAKLINSAAFKPEERAASLRALGFTFGHYGLMGGALGLPAAGLMQSAAGLLFGLGGDDDPWDKDAQEYRFRKWADDNGIEDGWADLILRGAPGALGVNLTDKVGAQHMLSVLPFTTFDPKQYNNFQEIAFDALGPSASMLSRMWSGIGHFQQHDMVGGMEKMMPSGVSDAIKAFRMQSTGEKTYNGDTVISPEELSLVDSALTLLGFTPMTIQDRWSRQRVLKSYEDAYQARTKTLKREYTEARSERNFRKARELEREWQALQKNKRAVGMRPASITDLRKAPREKAKREASVAGGVKFDSGNRKFVRELGELY